MRIQRFNESAGQGWRMLDREEMERMMSRDRVDDFTQAEIDLIIGLAKARHERDGSEVRVGEFHHSHSLSVRQFQSVVDGVWSTTFPGGERKPVGQSDLYTNNIYLYIVMTMGTSIDIIKSEDSYFYVNYLKSTRTGHIGIPAGLYVCDQFSGLVSFLKKIMGL